MMNFLTCTLGLLAVSATGAHAQKGGKKRPRPVTTTTVVMDNSETVNAYLEVPSGLKYMGECYNGPDYDIATPCEQSCGGTSYSLSGYQSNTEARELTLSIDQYNNGEPACGESVSFYTCAKLKVPEQATWTRVGNTVTVKAEGTTIDCGYYDEEGKPPLSNPLVGKKIAVDVVITCKKLNTNTNKCRNRSTAPDFISRSRNYSYNEDCSVDNVGKVTVDGVTRTFSYASFGRWRYKDRTTTRAPAPQAAAGPKASG
jgi:hypothetical protein